MIWTVSKFDDIYTYLLWQEVRIKDMYQSEDAFTV